MALVLTRQSITRWLGRQCISQKASFHRQTDVLNKNAASKTFFTSRRNVDLINKSESRRLGTITISNTRRFSLVSSVVSMIGLITGCVVYFKNRKLAIANVHSVLSTVSAASKDDGDDSIALPPSMRFNFIADVVEKAAPSVVYIELKERHPISRRTTTVSNGSGFIVRSDGLIVTNAHVVANKADVRVRLYDGKEMDGWVVAVDPISDLAAIKVDAVDLPVLEIGPSSKLRAGEWVIAMGSPLSLSNTVTCGIVSSVNRGSKELGFRNKDMEYIQTDALINFGNSGGPLVNLDGEVIGINTMKVTPGISFAIPSDYATSFLRKVDELLKRGQMKKRQWFSMGSDSTRRRFIGITMLTLNSQLLMELKTRVPDFPDIAAGVLVHKIILGSPAFNGGLRAGDIITEINGKPAQSSADVYRLVEESETLAIVAYRGQRRLTLKITSEEVR